MEVFTEEWCAACCRQLNAREGFRAVAGGWTGTVVLVMTADPAQGVDSERAVWIEPYPGGCRGARVATAADRASATYVLQADPGVWKRLLSGGGDPMSLLMSGKLRLARGGLFALARYAGAAREMLLAAGEVGGAFPSPRR